MKVLLLGEFSGFYSNLKDGLEFLGHDVDMINNGDGWKNIQSEQAHKMYSNYNNRFLKRIHNIFLLLMKIRKIRNYDIIQLIQPNIFGYRLNQNFLALKKLKKQNKKIFLSVAGDHYYIDKIYDRLSYRIPYNSKKVNNPSYKRNNDNVISLVDGIIPTMFSYAEAYRNNDKLLRTIPLPINNSKIPFIPQHFFENKVTIFHGINREDQKGTKYIVEALKRLEKVHPNDVTIVIDGKMSLMKYLKILEQANIIVDQALSYEYGMNAIYSMAMGKVVLSGNEPECQDEFNRSDIPVINIKPDVEDIYNKLEKLVLNKDEIIKIGKKSREFVEDFHSHIKVAQQYIDSWNSVGGNKDER